MGDRKYEAFLLRQVKRSHTIYSAGTWVFRLFVLACIGMFAAAMAMHVSVAMSLALLPAAIGFFFGSNLCKSMRDNYGAALKEMEFGVTHSKYRLPEEYSDETKKLRLEAAKGANSLRGHIIVYAVLAVALLAGAVAATVLSAPGGAAFRPVLLVLAGILAAIVIFLLVLTVRSIRELPAAKEYADQISATVESDGKK